MNAQLASNLYQQAQSEIRIAECYAAAAFERAVRLFALGMEAEADNQMNRYSELKRYSSWIATLNFADLRVHAAMLIDCEGRNLGDDPR